MSPRAPQVPCFGLAAAVVLADQLSKAWALQHLGRGPWRGWLPGLLDLELLYNRGAAFSLFSGAGGLLALISLLVALGLGLWILGQRQMNLVQIAGTGLLLGGTIGNGLDRWRLGAVVDFLALVPVRFPVFNLADMAINLAVICFLFDLLNRRGSQQP